MSDESQSTNWLATTSDSDPTPVAPPPLPTPDPAGEPKPTFSIMALFALIGGLAVPAIACVGSLLMTLMAYTNPNVPTLVSFSLAVALPGVPLAWFAWRRLQGRPAVIWQAQLWWIVVGVIALLGLISLGQVLISFQIVPAIIAAVTQPLVFAVGCTVLFTLAIGGWAKMSQLKLWSHFVSGAWVAVLFSFVAEIVMVGGLAFVVLLIWASVDPAKVQQLIQMFRAQPAQIDEQVILDVVRQPWVMALAYLVASIMIPLIEELAKSAGVIALIGQRPAPMNAFLGGLLGGLGFGFTESLSNLVNIQDPWFVLVVARLGTLAMHGFASSLVGWGWGQLARGRPDRLALAFLGAVSVHGLWNAAVVTFVFSGLYFADNPAAISPATILIGLIVGICLLVLVLLVPGCLAGVMAFGYRLRATAQTVNAPSQ
jgi:hypothetical protein